MTPPDPRNPHPDDPAHGAPAPWLGAGPGPGDRTPPGDVSDDELLDELASALLDGALDPDQAAAAHRRPGVSARLAAMEAARGAVGGPVPPPADAARDRAVAAALAAFDAAGHVDDADHAGPAGRDDPAELDGGAPAGHPHEPVDHLAARRKAGSGGGPDRRPRPLPRWLGAAAAVAIVVAGAAGVALLGDSGDEASDTAASMSDADSSAEGAGEGGADGDAEATEDDAQLDTQAEDEAAAHAPTREAVTDLGDVATDDDLVDRVAATLADAERTSPPATTDQVDPSAGAAEADQLPTCPGGVPAPLDDPAADVVLRGRAVLDGNAVDVWVVRTTGGDRVVALDPSCDVVVDRPLG